MDTAVLVRFWSIPHPEEVTKGRRDREIIVMERSRCSPLSLLDNIHSYPGCISVFDILLLGEALGELRREVVSWPVEQPVPLA